MGGTGGNGDGGKKDTDATNELGGEGEKGNLGAGGPQRIRPDFTPRPGAEPPHQSTVA